MLQFVLVIIQLTVIKIHRYAKKNIPTKESSSKSKTWFLEALELKKWKEYFEKKTPKRKKKSFRQVE